MADHVSSLCRSVYYQLRQLQPVVRSITEDAAKIVVQAFISSRLDYCNSLLRGIASNLLQKLQSVQNGAARLITKTGRWKHITPVLRELHWLPVQQRIDFKLVVLVYKTLHGQLRQYLTEDCQLLTTSPADHCDRLMSWREPQEEHISKTGVFASLDRVSRTLCLLHYVTETSHLYSIRDFWRHFCLSRAAAHSDCCFFAPCTNILTYLLTAKEGQRYINPNPGCLFLQ